MYIKGNNTPLFASIYCRQQFVMEVKILKKKWAIIGFILCVVMMFAACGDKIDPAVDDGSDSDTVSISSDAEGDQFYDWREGLKEALDVDVEVMLDEYDVNEATIKVNESAGIMLSGIFAETQEWKVEIENPELLELLAQGTEKNVVGERQGFDFFAFKGLKQGKTTVSITDVTKDTQEAGMTYTFTIYITE